MADILPFPDEAGRRTPDLNSRRAKTFDVVASTRAEIVIFPGVRIEHHEFSLADRLPGRRPTGSASGGDKPRRRRG